MLCSPRMSAPVSLAVHRPVAAWRLAAVALGAIVGGGLATLSGGCATGVPCTPETVCGATGACVIGRCREITAEVVTVESRRVVLLARKAAVVSSSDVPDDARATAFGAAASGEVVVLLDFDGDVGNDVEVEGAFVVMEPEVGSPGPTEAVTIDVRPVLGPWDIGVSWGRTPSLGLPLGAARVPPARRGAVRFDVTGLVAKKRSVGHGLALVARGDDPVGARMITMARSTSGPKLELYLKGP